MITQKQQELLSSLKDVFEEGNQITPATFISRIQSEIDAHKQSEDQKKKQIKERELVDEARLNHLYESATDIVSKYNIRMTKHYTGMGSQRSIYLQFDYRDEKNRSNTTATLHVIATSSGFEVGYPTYNKGKDTIAETIEDVITAICDWIIYYKKKEIA